ncbi:MAG: SRPBCC domain-containing protein [Planctomycetota bacterium]
MKGILGKLEFSLEREVVIRAPRAVVFRFFTDPARFASWWGAGSTIEGRVGGALRIAFAGGGGVATGEVLELVAPERIVFTYGYEGAGKPIAPGGSRVTITLAEHPQGTRLRLVHEIADKPTRDEHVQGWRYHMAVFSNVATNEALVGAGAAVLRWFSAWNEADGAKRASALGALVRDDIVFQDAYSSTSGRDDLVAHVAAAKVHMPGLVVEPCSDVRHCQGTALVDWLVKMPDGKTMAKGTNIFELAPDGRFMRVVGLWGKP